MFKVTSLGKIKLRDRSFWSREENYSKKPSYFSILEEIDDKGFPDTLDWKNLVWLLKNNWIEVEDV